VKGLHPAILFFANYGEEQVLLAVEVGIKRTS
jgi:hypothetical protein